MKIIKKTELPAGVRELTPLEMNRMHFSAPATEVKPRSGKGAK